MRFPKLLALSLIALCANAAVVSYTSPSAWTAAVSSYQQSTIDFVNANGNMYGYTEAGATFTGTASNNTPYLFGATFLNGFIYGPYGPGTLRVDLPGGTFGVAFDLTRYYGLAHPTDLVFSTGDTYSVVPVNAFVGFTSATAIQWVTMRVQTGAPLGIYNLQSDYPAILNAYLAVDPNAVTGTPEPATAALLLVPAAAAVLYKRRPRR